MRKFEQFQLARCKLWRWIPRRPPFRDVAATVHENRLDMLALSRAATDILVDLAQCRLWRVRAGAPKAR